jgi:hypothetical protein
VAAIAWSGTPKRRLTDRITVARDGVQGLANHLAKPADFSRLNAIIESHRTRK